MAIGVKGKLYRHHAVLIMNKFKHSFSKDKRLFICISVYPPDKRKRDIDNLTKCILDSIQKAKVFVDDNQIDELFISRHEPIKDGKIIIWLRECY